MHTACRSSVMLGKTKVISLFGKALFLFTCKGFKPWLDLRSRKGRDNSYLWPISLDLFQKKKKHLETDLLQVQHVLMCFIDLQEESECFNPWELFLGGLKTISDVAAWLGTVSSAVCAAKCGCHPLMLSGLISFCPLIIALAGHNYLHRYEIFFMDF